jgi:hypothetical protein
MIEHFAMGRVLEFGVIPYVHLYICLFMVIH